MKHKRITALTVTDNMGYSFDIPVRPGSARAILQLMDACLDTIGVTREDRHFATLAMSNAIMTLFMQRIVTAKVRDTTITPSLNAAISLPVGVSVPNGKFDKRGVKTIRYSIGYWHLSHTDDAMLDTYRKYCNMTDTTDVPFETWCERTVKRMLNGNHDVFWFSRYTRLFGDLRGVGMTRRDGQLVYQDGEVVTLPHPVYGHNIVAIANDKYEQVHGERVTHPTIPEGTVFTIRSLTVTVADSSLPPFTLNLDVTAIASLIRVFRGLLQSIVYRQPDIRYLGIVFQNWIGSYLERNGLRGDISPEVCNPELVYHAVMPIGHQPVNVYHPDGTPNVEQFTKLPSAVIDIDDYHQAVLDGRRPDDLYSAYQAAVSSALLSMIGGQSKMGLVVGRGHKVGDPRAVTLYYRGDHFVFDDGERLQMPHPVFGDNTIVALYDKYARRHLTSHPNQS